MAALERLCAAQQIQMQLIEKPSTKLEDHIAYYSAARTENTLFFAARKKNITRLGFCPVPTLATASANAKAAIEMHLLLKDLLQSPFGGESWSLVDLSHERYKAPPLDTLKKDPRIVEVIFDGDPQNKVWHTCWGRIYVRASEGWTLTTSGVDCHGVFCTMQGVKEYYQPISSDAERFSTSGTWEVVDQNQSYFFPPRQRDTADGPPAAEEPRRADGPCSSVAAEPDSPSRCDQRCGSRGASSSRSRGGARVHPYLVSGGCGILGAARSSSTVQSTFSQSITRHPESCTRPPSPDSTEEEVSPPSSSPTHSSRPTDFDLLQGGPKACLLIEGNGNKVKCLRYRLKKNHRRRFDNITTTFWATKDEGSDRHGNGTILVTFGSTSARQSFLDQVSIPGELSARSITISID